MSVLLFLLVLFVLILVHEWGHFIVAKKVGMRVDEFGIGFPPKLFGIRRGETEYTFNALPIGGFVKIFGEDGEEASASTEQSRAFSQKSYVAQALVLVAGVAMNVIFAWVLFSGALMIGMPTVVDEASAGPEAEFVVTGVQQESPAARAGIPAGAEILGVVTPNGELVGQTPTAFQTYIAGQTEAVMIRYRVGGGEETVSVVPEEVNVAGETRNIVGVSVALIETQQFAPHTALYEGVLLTATNLRDVTIGITHFLGDALTFNADFSQVAGPVGIAGMVDDVSARGVAPLMFFAAFISLNLAVINLLPFPALDGGRLVFVGIESLTRKKIPARVAGVTNALGFALLIFLMIAVTYNDLLRIF